jgi:OFA family oxalate/formate antiporter-like MFS transporter
VNYGISKTFYILGAAYFIIIFCSAQYLAPPKEGWVPKGMAAAGQKSGGMKLKEDLRQLTANEAVRTRQFWALWLMLFINVTCGIAILSVASPMAQELVGMTATGAATMVGIMGLFNGGGRIVWATISDYIGRPNVYTLFFAFQIIAFFMLPNITVAILFSVIVYMIMTCYGGGFSSIPAYIGDLFGTKQLGAIHGYILTAWAAAGLAGPIFVSWVRETTGSYQGTLVIFSGIFIIALTVSLLIRLDIKKIK